MTLSAGSQRGKNSVYIVQLDGLKLCHIGDLGHNLTAEQAKEIGKVDVLFTPVAGGATIGPDVAWSVTTKLDPKIIIPMHYNTGLSGASPWLPRAMPISLDELLKGKNNVEKTKGPTFSARAAKLHLLATLAFPRRSKHLIYPINRYLRAAS